MSGLDARWFSAVMAAASSPPSAKSVTIAMWSGVKNTCRHADAQYACLVLLMVLCWPSDHLFEFDNEWVQAAQPQVEDLSVHPSHGSGASLYEFDGYLHASRPGVSVMCPAMNQCCHA